MAAQSNPTNHAVLCALMHHSTSSLIKSFHIGRDVSLRLGNHRRGVSLSEDPRRQRELERKLERALENEARELVTGRKLARSFQQLAADSELQDADDAMFWLAYYNHRSAVVLLDRDTIFRKPEAILRFGRYQKQVAVFFAKIAGETGSTLTPLWYKGYLCHQILAVLHLFDHGNYTVSEAISMVFDDLTRDPLVRAYVGDGYDDYQRACAIERRKLLDAADLDDVFPVAIRQDYETMLVNAIASMLAFAGSEEPTNECDPMQWTCTALQAIGTTTS